MIRESDRELGGELLVIISCGGIDDIVKWQQMKGAELTFVRF
jgi:hypothetical protein